MILGTAQLGMAYGIANKLGRPGEPEVREIVRTAWERGIRHFDTAQAYGDSETTLGLAFRQLGLSSQALVISKMGSAWTTRNPEETCRNIVQSLERLGVTRLWGILAHDEAVLDQPISPGLLEARRLGLVEHLGVSVYSVDRALQALATDGLEIIQVPANIFDRRMHRAGVFRKAEACGKIMLVRSVFLQGLLLMNPAEAPVEIPRARNALQLLEEFCATEQVFRTSFALGYVREMAPRAELIIGAESAKQVRDNCQAEHLANMTMLATRWDRIWPEDVSPLLDPRAWRLVPVRQGRETGCRR